MSLGNPVRSLRDHRLDRDPALLEAFLEERVVEQVDYAWRSGTPAVVAMMRDAGLTPKDIQSLPDFTAKFPLLTKKLFRHYGSDAFLPLKYHDAFRTSQAGLPPHERIHLFTRYTGGTSIRSVNDFTRIAFSNSDWESAKQAMARYLEEDDPSYVLGGRAFINYTYDHIAAPFTSDLLVRLFARAIIPRPPNLTNEDAFALMRRERCDSIVTPPTAYRGKGFGLDQLLAADTDLDDPYIAAPMIKSILTSSTPLTARLYDCLASLGIRFVKDFGGSTDTAATTINCPADPHRFHITQGHIYFEVLDDERRHVAGNHNGRVVVSRIAGETHADPLVGRLRAALRRTIEADSRGEEPAVADQRTLEAIYGPSLFSHSLTSLVTHVDALYNETARVVPNQATQLLRFSGTMNNTTWIAPLQCGCGRTTAKAIGLERTWDFDGSPADLAMTRPARLQAPAAGVSSFRRTGFDGCGVAAE